MTSLMEVHKDQEPEENFVDSSWNKIFEHFDMVDKIKGLLIKQDYKDFNQAIENFVESVFFITPSFRSVIYSQFRFLK